MLDGLTLDQLRTFVAAAECGSFSAAGRRLKRAQSVVSHTIANLELQLGFPVFDRSGRIPLLNERGRVLLASARSITGGADQFKAHAASLAAGLEAELSVVVDVMFPGQAIAQAVRAFRTQFRNTPLRIQVEALGAVVLPVLDRSCALGIMGSLPMVPDELSAEPLFGIRLVHVVAPDHPLAVFDGPISTADLNEHVQLVLTDRTEGTKGRDAGILSTQTWRLADLGSKHAYLRHGLGWGGMPWDHVAADLADGRLIEIRTEFTPPGGFVMPMSVIYCSDALPGPAGQWFINRLRGAQG
jgi:DNA-binding transcriptional LysR family regulator